MVFCAGERVYIVKIDGSGAVCLQGNVTYRSRDLDDDVGVSVGYAMTTESEFMLLEDAPLARSGPDKHNFD